jgi:hypothetical protein
MKMLACVAIVATGCFDSIVSDPCQTGFSLSHGACVADHSGPDAGPDGAPGGDGHDGGTVDVPDSGSVDVPDAGPGVDAFVCEAPKMQCGDTCIDTTNDPNHCGSCTRVCASGICENSQCIGDIVGHIVAIGHDYQSYHQGMARVLGNAIALGVHTQLTVGFYRGSASDPASIGAYTAANIGANLTGRPHSFVGINAIATTTLAGLDAVVIEAQAGDGNAVEALGQTWASPLGAFLSRGGVVIVLEGTGGVSYRAAAGAGLYTVAAPSDATSQQVYVADPTDAVANAVPSPYLAETTSASFPGMPAVVANAGDDAVVFHLAR